ncbi:glycosyltransferase family 2 protein [Agromyces sp. NPDC127015]|uniref:glycosyltransferase family 2 protein n=1 Tax=Agromyces sp. NPDC127015 TaxID=3347108 RepID=UPI0036471ECC
MLKVTVIVPTFRSGPGLDRLVSSLDAQSMPEREFEVIFVDDGSPDDTWLRLQGITGERDHMSAYRIAPSGWPSRPRNTALEHARGEYVLFLDHDDELGPHALEAGYELAKAHGADVVNGKESRTHLLGWAMTVFTENRGNAMDPLVPVALMPMTPHKMYRRALLEEHRIRFPEGGRRIWEDIHFNLDVYAKAKTVSVLADTAFYHWVWTGANSSADEYQDDRIEYWHRLSELIDRIRTTLQEPRLHPLRDALLLVQYRARILGFVLTKVSIDDPADVATADAMARRYVDSLLTPELERELTVDERAKTFLIADGRVDLARMLATVDAGVSGRATIERLAWQDGRLMLTGSASWAGRELAGPRLRVGANGRVVRDLPPELEAALPAELRDAEDDVARASVELGVRDEATKAVWLLTTEVERLRRVDSEGRLTLELRFSSAIDPRSSILGKPMQNGEWSVNARTSLAAHINHRTVAGSLSSAPAVIDGRAAIAQFDDRGVLMISLGDPEQILDHVSLNAASADVTRTFGRFDVVIPVVPPLAVFGATTVVGVATAQARPDEDVPRWRRAARVPLIGPMLTASASTDVTGEIEFASGESGETVLRIGFPRMRPGTFRLTGVIGSREIALPLRLVVGLRGARLEIVADGT